MSDKDIMRQLHKIEWFKRCARMDMLAYHLSPKGLQAGRQLAKLEREKKALILKLSGKGYRWHMKTLFPQAFYPADKTTYKVTVSSTAKLSVPLANIVVEYIYAWHVGRNMKVYKAETGDIDYITFEGADARMHILSSMSSRHIPESSSLGSFKFVQQSTLQRLALGEQQGKFRPIMFPMLSS